MKIFSLVLPCYNEGENIESLLNAISKLKKLHDDLEIIVVENGSTDDSLHKIKNHPIYENNFIRLVEIKKNLGYGYGIMAGINKSTGQYVGWCHADLQNNLEDIYNIFKENYDELKKKYKTSRFINKFEKTKIISERAQQLANGSISFLKNPETYGSVYNIALEELNQKKIPFIIRRPISNTYEYWKLEDLEII